MFHHKHSFDTQHTRVGIFAFQHDSLNDCLGGVDTIRETNGDFSGTTGRTAGGTVGAFGFVGFVGFVGVVGIVRFGSAFGVGCGCRRFRWSICHRHTPHRKCIHRVLVTV